MKYLIFLSNVKAFGDSKPAVMALMINEDLPPVLSTYFDKELILQNIIQQCLCANINCLFMTLMPKLK